jgi:thiol-disulfide isomerase/thioredoxin
VHKHIPTGLLSFALIATLIVSVSAQSQSIRVVGSEDVHQLVRENQGKVVVLNFWASWCPPCLKEFPDIIRMYNEYESQGLEVIAVSMNADDEIEDIEDFLGNYDPPFSIYRAVNQEETFLQGISEEWFGEMPTTLIFDAEGNRVQMHKKQLTYEELVAGVSGLLP